MASNQVRSSLMQSSDTTLTFTRARAKIDQAWNTACEKALHQIALRQKETEDLDQKDNIKIMISGKLRDISPGDLTGDLTLPAFGQLYVAQLAALSGKDNARDLFEKAYRHQLAHRDKIRQAVEETSPEMVLQSEQASKEREQLLRGYRSWKSRKENRLTNKKLDIELVTQSDKFLVNTAETALQWIYADQQALIGADEKDSDSKTERDRFLACYGGAFTEWVKLRNDEISEAIRSRDVALANALISGSIDHEKTIGLKTPREGLSNPGASHIKKASMWLQEGGDWRMLPKKKTISAYWPSMLTSSHFSLLDAPRIAGSDVEENRYWSIMTATGLNEKPDWGAASSVDELQARLRYMFTVPQRFGSAPTNGHRINAIATKDVIKEMRNIAKKAGAKIEGDSWDDSLSINCVVSDVKVNVVIDTPPENSRENSEKHWGIIGLSEPHDAELPTASALSIFGHNYCEHPDGEWVPNSTMDAAILRCPTCFRERVAWAPAHRLPEPMRSEFLTTDKDERDYLERERAWRKRHDLSLDGTESMDKLMDTDGLYDLNPKIHANGVPPEERLEHMDNAQILDAIFDDD